MQTMTCPTVATLSTSSMEQDNIVAAARSAATAVTSGIRNSLSTLSSGTQRVSFYCRRMLAMLLWPDNRTLHLTFRQMVLLLRRLCRWWGSATGVQT